jgi:hypothetical protein
MIGFDPPVRSPDATCVVYYHNASCSSVQTEGEDPHYQEACLDLRGRTTGVIASARLSNDPLTFVRYKTEPVHVGLHWIKKP